MKRLQKWLPGLLIFAVLVTSMLGGAAYAKYTTQLQIGGSLNITANLGSITLLEHQAVKQDDGSYILGSGTTTTGNTYSILPGLDIPKDPYVTANVGAIPVYIFVEVVSTLSDSAVSFDIDSTKWIKISDNPNNGEHGGTVYVYTGGEGTAKAITNTTITANVLLNNIVEIGQELNADGNKNTDLGLTFYACMGQVAAGQSGGTISLVDVYDSAK